MTSAAAFRRLASTAPRCVWLDGWGLGRSGAVRASTVARLDEDDVSLTWSAADRQVVRHHAGRARVVGDDPFAVLEAELAGGPAHARWFGYVGYAARADLPALTGGDVPDAVWMRPSHVEVDRHRPAGPPDTSTLPRDGATGPVPAWYASAFARVQEHLRAGDTYEVNLTYRLARASGLDPVDAYLRLRRLNPAPYAGFLQHDVPGHRGWLLSSSPECYARVTADRRLEARPIKGTTARGRTPEEDRAARRLLRSDPKFRSENLMVLDLVRNDVSMVCRPGTVEVPRMMAVESYPAVHQLVSTVTGRLREDVSTLQALRALFPAGSMTGAPKLRTMEVIAEVEDTPRGPYSGALGWISADGRADLAVVIRSLATDGTGSYLLGTGGGITVRSDVVEEYAESRWKADRLLRALR